MAIIFVCDETVREARNIEKVCYKLQEELDEESKEKAQLTKFARESRYFVQHFNAAGYIRIDKRAIFGLLGTTMTYFIVVVQFNESEYRHPINKTS